MFTGSSGVSQGRNVGSSGESSSISSEAKSDENSSDDLNRVNGGFISRKGKDRNRLAKPNGKSSDYPAKVMARQVRLYPTQEIIRRRLSPDHPVNGDKLGSVYSVGNGISSDVGGLYVRLSGVMEISVLTLEVGGLSHNPEHLVPTPYTAAFALIVTSAVARAPPAIPSLPVTFVAVVERAQATASPPAQHAPPLLH